MHATAPATSLARAAIPSCLTLGRTAAPSVITHARGIARAVVVVGDWVASVDGGTRPRIVVWRLKGARLTGQGAIIIPLPARAADRILLGVRTVTEYPAQFALLALIRGFAFVTDGRSAHDVGATHGSIRAAC